MNKSLTPLVYLVERNFCPDILIASLSRLLRRSCSCDLVRTWAFHSLIRLPNEAMAAPHPLESYPKECDVAYQSGGDRYPWKNSVAQQHLLEPALVDSACYLVKIVFM